MQDLPARRAVDEVEEGLGGTASDFFHGLDDDRKRRMGDLGEGAVVESEEGDPLLTAPIVSSLFVAKSAVGFSGSASRSRVMR